MENEVISGSIVECPVQKKIVSIKFWKNGSMSCTLYTANLCGGPRAYSQCLAQ